MIALWLPHRTPAAPSFARRDQPGRAGGGVGEERLRETDGDQLVGVADVVAFDVADGEREVGVFGAGLLNGGW